MYPLQKDNTQVSAYAADSDSRTQEVEAKLKTVTEERNNLQERLKKSNEENLKLSNTIRVSFFVSISIVCFYKFN